MGRTGSLVVNMGLGCYEPGGPPSALIPFPIPRHAVEAQKY